MRWWKNSTSKATCHAYRTLFHSSSGLLGDPCQLECKVLFIFTHTCSIVFKLGDFGDCSMRSISCLLQNHLWMRGHGVPDGYPAGTQEFLQDNIFRRKAPIHSLISLDSSRGKFPMDAFQNSYDIHPSMICLSGPTSHAESQSEHHVGSHPCINKNWAIARTRDGYFIKENNISPIEALLTTTNARQSIIWALVKLILGSARHALIP